MSDFSIKECLRFGWDTFKKRPWFFVGFSAMLLVFSLFSDLVSSAIRNSGGMGADAFGLLLSLFISVYMSFGQTRLVLKAHDSVEQVRLAEFWSFKRFGMYAMLYILLSLALLVGFVLLIVPGVILTLVTFCALFIFIDKDLSPIESVKESARITEGHLWQLFLFSIVLIGLNILGAIALLVGLLVSIPVTLLATVHAYRTLAALRPKIS